MSIQEEEEEGINLYPSMRQYFLQYIYWSIECGNFKACVKEP